MEIEAEKDGRKSEDLLWRLEDISAHGLAKSVLVFPRACHSGSILASILDPRFEFLIPGICTDTIDDANY